MALRRFDLKAGGDSFSFKDETEPNIAFWLGKYPEDRKRSAVIGALHAAQHENDGFLTTEIMNDVAAYLDLPPIQVYEVATFYSMFQTKPVGRHNVAICTNVSCMLRGAEELVAHVGMPRSLLRCPHDDGRSQVPRESDD